MKKLLLLIAIAGMAAFLGWQLFSGKEAKPVDDQKDQPLSISSNSNAFDHSFSTLMNEYFGIRDALVEWDSAKADIAAKALQQRADSLPFSLLKGDSSIILTAQNLAISISSETKGFIGETTIEQKRRAFNMLTDEIYNIIRTVRYSGQIIYYIKCPTAFKDSSEGYWLNNSNKVINPYLGNKHPVYRDKMLGSGEIVDSMDFAKK
jgi:hypothetical protein